MKKKAAWHKIFTLLETMGPKNHRKLKIAMKKIQLMMSKDKIERLYDFSFRNILSD